MLCSIRNDANSNSKHITSADRSAPANDDTDATFKYFRVAQGYVRSLRPPQAMLTSQRHRLQKAKVLPNADLVIQCVSKKTSPTFLAVTLESIVRFS